MLSSTSASCSLSWFQKSLRHSAWFSLTCHPIGLHILRNSGSIIIATCFQTSQLHEKLLFVYPSLPNLLHWAIMLHGSSLPWTPTVRWGALLHAWYSVIFIAPKDEQKKLGGDPSTKGPFPFLNFLWCVFCHSNEGGSNKEADRKMRYIRGKVYQREKWRMREACISQGKRSILSHPWPLKPKNQSSKRTQGTPKDRSKESPNALQE